MSATERASGSIVEPGRDVEHEVAASFGADALVDEARHLAVELLHRLQLAQPPRFAREAAIGLRVHCRFHQSTAAPCRAQGVLGARDPQRSAAALPAVCGAVAPAAGCCAWIRAMRWLTA